MPCRRAGPAGHGRLGRGITQGRAHGPSRADRTPDRRERNRGHGAQCAAPRVFRVDHVRAANERGACVRRSSDADQKLHFRLLPCGHPETAGRLGFRRRDVKTRTQRCAGGGARGRGGCCFDRLARRQGGPRHGGVEWHRTRHGRRVRGRRGRCRHQLQHERTRRRRRGKRHPGRRSPLAHHAGERRRPRRRATARS